MSRSIQLRASRALFRWLLAAFLAAASLGLQWAPPSFAFISRIEHVLRDRLYRLLATDEPEHRVLIVDVDEASLAEVGPWPWPRSRIADLLEALVVSYSARAVGVDIVFPSPADAQGDERLAALTQLAPVVLAQVFDFVNRSPPLITGNVVLDAPQVPGSAQWPTTPATGYVGNHAGLASAPCVGNIGLQPDADGIIRRVPLLTSWNGRQVPLLPLAMMACPTQRATGVPSLDALADGPARTALWELPFRRQSRAYTVVPARAILDGTAPRDLVRDRWVLVGSSAMGLHDRAATPLDAVTSGVMVHANATTALLDALDGTAASLPFDARWLATLWTVCTLGIGAWSLGRYSALWLIPGGVVVAASWIGIACWLISRGAMFSVSGPLLGYLLLLSMLSLELWMAQRERGQILRSFASYLAPSVLDELVHSSFENPMAPQHREISVLSADMQDYTGLTNSSTLQDAAELTREFLQCLTQPVLAFGGTLDKYTGDGMVAFWGAPLSNASHAVQAVAAARTIVESVRKWNEGRIRRGLAPARVRIGVESGSVLVGDLGTEFRRTYTAVGDCINTASKLQAIAKTLSCDLVVGPVAASLATDCGLVPIIQVQLPGHKEVSVLWHLPSLGSSLPQDASPQPLPVARAA